LTAKRDQAVATQFFEKAMRHNGEPEKITMDKSGANKAAIDGINQVSEDTYRGASDQVSE
jgi:putative transposase